MKIRTISSDNNIFYLKSSMKSGVELTNSAKLLVSRLKGKKRVMHSDLLGYNTSSNTRETLGHIVSDGLIQSWTDTNKNGDISYYYRLGKNNV